MNNSKEYTERRGSLIILSITTVAVFVIVVAAVCVLIFVEKSVARIILFCLIALLLLIAILSFGFLENRRREAQKRRDKGATELVNQIYEQQRHQTQSTLPVHMYDGNGKSATWALTQPWRYSQRSTLKL